MLLAAGATWSLSATQGESVSAMCSPGQWTTGSAFVSKGYQEISAATPAACCARCSTDEQCLAWNQKMPSQNCFLYHSVTSMHGNPTQNSTLGTKFPPTPPPPPGPPPPPAPKGAMNVLMIAIDDMRPELEPYGQTHMVTPHMQKLADRSMLFERAYVQVAVCMPSRNALLFSRRPDTAKAWSISATQWPRTCGGPACGGNECGPRCGIKAQSGPGKLGVTLPMWFLQNGWYTQGCDASPFRPLPIAYTLSAAVTAGPTLVSLLVQGWQDLSRRSQHTESRLHALVDALHNKCRNRNLRGDRWTTAQV